jgi:hypothetical protein
MLYLPSLVKHQDNHEDDVSGISFDTNATECKDIEEYPACKDVTPKDLMEQTILRQQSEMGKFHDQGDAKWIVIRGQL